MKHFLIRFFTWWNGYTLGTRFYLWRKAEYVGQDLLGNTYYKQKNGNRRFVIYNGLAEASTIPPGWHAWIHYRTDVRPNELDYETKSWQLPHQPNKTGTSTAYRPAGSIHTPVERPVVSGDYGAWTP